MNKITKLSVLMLFIIIASCTKEETPKPSEYKTTQTQPIINTTINIDGIWYDYTHIAGNGFNVPVKFIFFDNTYSYSEYNNTNGWMQIIGSAIVYRTNDSISMPYNQTNYKFYGEILNDSTIQITQYTNSDTLPSYQIHK